MKPQERPKRRRHGPQGALAGPPEASLLDVLDSLLNKGVVTAGDIMLGVAGVDLIYLRLSTLLCAIDRLTAPGSRRAPRARRRASRRKT